MKKRSLGTGWIILIVACSLICVSIIGAWAYVATRPVILILMDPTYQAVSWPDASRGVSWKALSSGYRIVDHIIDTPKLVQGPGLEQAVSDQVAASHPKMVVCSPLVAGLLDVYGVSENVFVMPDETVPFLLALGPTVDGSLFDVVCVPAADAGWDEAATALATSQAKTPLMTGFLYQQGDVQGEAALKSFVAAFPPDRLYEAMQSETTTSRWAEGVLSDMQRYGVMVVACPWVEGMGNLFRETTGLSWVVDASFSDLVPKKYLSGVVADDIWGTIEGLVTSGAIDNGHQGRTLTLPLVRQYLDR